MTALPQRRPGSSRSLQPGQMSTSGRGIQTSHRKFTVAKITFGSILVAVGYYYSVSESMLDQYSYGTHYYMTPSRATSVLMEAPPQVIIEAPPPQGPLTTRIESPKMTLAPSKQSELRGLSPPKKPDIWAFRQNKKEQPTSLMKLQAYQRKNDLWKRQREAVERMTRTVQKNEDNKRNHRLPKQDAKPTDAKKPDPIKEKTKDGTNKEIKKEIPKASEPDPSEETKTTATKGKKERRERKTKQNAEAKKDETKTAIDTPDAKKGKQEKAAKKQTSETKKTPKETRGNTSDLGERGTKTQASPKLKETKTVASLEQAAATTVRDNKVPKFVSAEEHVASSTATNISYVHYTGCCGLGHRLARMSNAHHAAQRLNFALKGTWPSCNKTNVYEYLFEDDTQDWALANHTRSNQVVQLHNEIPGYMSVSRTPKRNASAACDTCHPDKIDSDYRFYSQLLQRFRKRDQVQEFLTNHKFFQHTVIGMHTRAGNGEGGDFENKNRGIANTTQFVEQVRQHVLSLIKDNEWKDPPLLFLATDTAAMVDSFRQAMTNDKIPIVELPQIRATEGAGILFGDKKNRERRKSLRAEKERKVEEAGAEIVDETEQRQECLQGWDQAFMDMMLLASADVVLATRRSSFVQTIPLSMMMGRKERKVDKPYCEVSQDALLTMVCHESYMDWCCCEQCVAQEELERRQSKKRRNSEYVKQFRPDLWDKPVMELYEKSMKPASGTTRPGKYFS